ncbi:S9 family peptidase [Rubricoccus marinus]|uniref:S9 family peptidase n=1 Tax=Rubricoccus marinus TaxID=716817 RepID=A0A259U3A0_9BACT|nr:S9 family peptidase [Rubricoccus marinus]
MRRLLLAAVFLVCASGASAQERPTLTIDLITQDPATWIGDWPEAPYWTDRGDRLYFTWNPAGRFPGDSLFSADPSGGDPVLVSAPEARELPPAYGGLWRDRLAYSPSATERVFERGGDLWRYIIETDEMQRLTRTTARESGARYSPDGRSIVYREGDALYAMDLDSGSGASSGVVRQLTDLRRGNEPKDKAPSDQDAYLRSQQTRLLDVIRRGVEQDSLRQAAREREDRARGLPPTHYVGDGRIGDLRIDPTERYVTFTLSPSGSNPTTRMVDYVTASGYAEEITARAKVGAERTASTLWVQDVERDSVYKVDLSTLPGAFVAADFFREKGQETDSSRVAFAIGPDWSPDGRYAVVEVRTIDNKDRWIARLDPASGALTVLDHQRDEAWIAGPGISWWGGGSEGGWLPDGRTYWYKSEASGWSHLHTVDVASGETRQLTSGEWEVESVQLTRDGTAWILQTGEASNAERQIYRMPLAGGTRQRITRQPGRYDAALSPDDQTLAMLFSTANQPPEVMVRSAFPASPEARTVTDSPSNAWRAYPWRAAEIVEIPASDGAGVPARIYRPENPNGAAVFFVHGAGYLQNAHNWWSGYYREYQFHNMLADEGYVVLDLDYRASAGYGRDWRTAVYRHMGGRDLQDYVDASRWVGSEFGIEPERVAIYGGSYGGFLTLMALFTEPEHFGSGAAMRSVTDWAHYNDTYTRNILNSPLEDPEAYLRSSPIEFADGLEDPLLMTHGLVDDNVQPQDIFRLSQRLIELGKRDWELAIAPVEPHGYREASSWADKLHRIHDLIEMTVGPDAPEADTEG